MIKFAAALSLLALGLGALCREARYIDSAFELNMPGYLFNIGARKYLGMDTIKKDDISLVDDARKAVRVRFFLNQPKDKGSYLILLDNDSLNVKQTGRKLSYSDLYSQQVLDVCRKTSPRKLIATNYTGDDSSEFYVSPPMLVNENGFQIYAGDQCVGVDSSGVHVVTKACMEYPKKDRNRQIFVWVPSDAYDRGEDPTNYAPNPYIAVVDIKKVAQGQKDCLRKEQTKTGVFDAMANSSTVLPVGGNGLKGGGIFKMLAGIPPTTDEPEGSCVQLIDRYGL